MGGKSGDPPVSVRNEVLKQMAPEPGPGVDTSRGPGRKVRLANGMEVIFWFNIGPPGASLRDSVYVTDAGCPHQGVCLNTGELKDIEDVAGRRRGMIRCSRHNKTFDLKTGESPGNAEVLRTYKCRFEHGHWYVAVGFSGTTPTPSDSAGGVCQAIWDAANSQGSMVAEPACDEISTAAGPTDPSSGDVEMENAEEPMWKRPRGDLVNLAAGMRVLGPHATLG